MPPSSDRSGTREKADKHRHWSLWCAVQFLQWFWLSFTTRHIRQERNNIYTYKLTTSLQNPSSSHAGSFFTALTYHSSLLLPPLTAMGEATPARKCAGGDCDNDAGSLQCPTCLKLGVKDSYFCSQDCFKRNWVSEFALIYYPVLQSHVYSWWWRAIHNRTSPPVLPHADQT